MSSSNREAVSNIGCFVLIGLFMLVANSTDWKYHTENNTSMPPGLIFIGFAFAIYLYLVAKTGSNSSSKSNNKKSSSNKPQHYKEKENSAWDNSDYYDEPITDD